MQQLLCLSISQRSIAALLTPFYFLFQSKELLLRFAMLVMSVGMMSGVIGQATVTSDKDDYAPLSNAVFTGAGFAPFEQVVLKVKNLTQPCNTVSADSSYYPWTVTADGNGAFVTNWTVCDCIGDSLRLKATGQTSGLAAYAYFTDAPSLASISPNSGPTSGGTLVTLTGSGFVPSATSITVAFGATSVPGTRVNNTTVTATAPAHASGTVNIVITVVATGGGNSGSASLSNVYTYTKEDQTISFANPGTKTYGDADFNLGATASSGLAVTYTVQSGPATIVSGNMLHITGAGSVTVRASQAGDVNYDAAPNVDQTFTISKAATTTVVTINGGPFTYTGAAQTPATVSVTGAGGLNLTPTATYANNIDAGTATASYTYAETANYLSSSDSKTFEIGKAATTTVVTIVGGPFTYTGAAQTPATVSVTGAGGLNLTPTATYANNIDAGTATASYTYAETANYLSSSDSKTFEIGKAATTTVVTIVGGPFTYTGAAQTPATVSVTGAGGLNLTPTATYANNIDAGIATASYTYAESANYLGSSDSKNFTIGKATATVSVNAYSVTYDGQPHTSTYSITGVNGESGATVGTINVTATTHTNAGTYPTDAWSFTGGANYNDANGTVSNTIGKADATVNVTGYTGTYDALPHGATGTATGVGGVNLAAGLTLGATFTNVPGGTANWTFNGGANYNNQSGSVAIVITQKSASVTPNALSKYCGQADPTFTGTLSGFITSDNVTASYSRNAGESVVGLYAISAVLSPAAVLGNYDITYNTAMFTINGLALDASASSTPVPIGQNATLSAVVSPAVAGVTVKFYVDGVEKGSGVTNGSGIATYTLTGLTTTDVYKIEAIAGTGGCSSTAAYLPVYDPNSAFVTGGGWIDSEAGSLKANPSVVGKANFGFVSKYKKGSSIVDGNTEFQFHAGDINFKSTMHESGSLVISGAKATYRGTGTINGLAGYKFTIVAIDGNWNNGFGPDKFRIKITTTAGLVIYDNQMGKDDNADDATVLGGGSIVIHEVKKKTANRMDAGVLILTPTEFNVKVLGNPSLTTFRLQLQGSNMQEKFTVKVVDVNGRLIEVQQNLYAGQVIELGSKYTQGTYFAEVMQGTNRKVVKLIKMANE
jgi:hypothetical protein